MGEQTENNNDKNEMPPRSVADELVNGIVKSRHFERSRQLCELLRYLIEQRFISNPTPLKEYSIALHVFGRDESFDPATDNIVRQEMRRLRTKLNEYYTDEGLGATWTVEVPKGSYLIKFHRRSGRLLAPWSTISHFQIRSLTRESSACVVYLADDVALGRRAVLTQVRGNDNEETAACLAAIRASSGILCDRLLSPYVIEQQTIGEVLIATLHLPSTLSDRLAAGPLAPPDARRVALDISRALAAGHETGLVHGAIGPEYVYYFDTAQENILHASTAPVMLAPFGLARIQSLNDERIDSFRAPEVVAGEQPTRASDIWSYGAMLCAVSGVQPPYNAQTALTIPRAEIKTIATRCLQPKPEDRSASAAEIRSTLESSVTRDLLVSQDRQSPRASRSLWFAVAALVTLVLAIVAGMLQFRRMESQPAVAPRVAVLRFENLNADAANAPFVEGVTDLLSAKLASMHSVQVVARRSLPFQIDVATSTKDLAHLLRADYIVAGRLHKQGDRFTGSVTLTRADDESGLWTGTFDGEWREVFPKVDALGESLVRRLGLSIQSTGRAKDFKDVRVDAYDLYLYGRHYAIAYANLHQPSLFNQAEQRLRRTLELEPNFSPALYELAQLYAVSAFPPPGNQAELLRTSAIILDRLLALDPDNIEGHVLAARLAMTRSEIDRALDHITHSLNLDPHEPLAHYQKAIWLQSLGFWEDALVSYRHCIERDPFPTYVYSSYISLLVRMGRLREAETVIDRQVSIGPARAFHRAYLALAKKDYSYVLGIREEVRRLGSSTLNDSLNLFMGIAETELGFPEKGRAVLYGMPEPGVRVMDGALILAADLGDKDYLLDRLRSDPYYGNYRWLISEPRFTRFMDDPRFRQLAREFETRWRESVRIYGKPLGLTIPDLPLRGNTTIVDAPTTVRGGS